MELMRVRTHSRTIALTLPLHPPCNSTPCRGSLGESADAHKFRPFHHGPRQTQEEMAQGEALRDVYTVTVGRKPTEARYYVRDAYEVGRMLRGLVKGEVEPAAPSVSSHSSPRAR